MNVAIIGCGYVGRAVAQYWRQAGCTVTATTTTPDRLDELSKISDRALIVHGNDPTTLCSALTNQDTVLVSVGAKGPNSYEETYLNTAKTLAEVLPELPSVRQIIYTGSYAVYGDRQGAWVDELTPVMPANRNGEILAETEQCLLGTATPQRQVCVFRLGGIYGPGRELVKIFSRAAGKTRPGTGSEPSNWIHLDDIVGAIAFARQQRLSGIYNLVQDVTLTSRELIEQVCQRHHLEPVQWDASQPSDRPYNAKVSNQKLKAAGYQLQHPQMIV